MRWIALALLLVTGCSRETEEPANDMILTEAPAPPPPPPAENVAAVPVADRRSPEAAVAVLSDYFRLVGEKKFVEAHRLWSTDTELSDGAFAASFDQFASYRGTIVGPGRLEGAAGSSYIDLPVEVTGRLTSGGRFRQTGTFTLRRANDVPGATPEQLEWRIVRSDLRPRSLGGGFRFAGRWATDERNCAARGWVFTASSLKTPDGSSCSFSRMREVPGGYDIAASCMSSGPARNDRLRLRYAESARALLFESRTIADAGLVRCP